MFNGRQTLVFINRRTILAVREESSNKGKVANQQEFPDMFHLGSAWSLPSQGSCSR